MQTLILYPHQLFSSFYFPTHKLKIILIEEPLYFTQYNFHAQKLMLHRASMKAYQNELNDSNFITEYIDCAEYSNEKLLKLLKDAESIFYFNTIDNWLDKKLSNIFNQLENKVVKLDSQNFLLTDKDILNYKDYDKNKFFFHNFCLKMDRCDIL
jgi:deoxyribodipyrimidine photolyase-related protein